MRGKIDAMGKKQIRPELEAGARPNATEIEVVEILISEGIVKKCVMFLKPSRIKDDHTPDILMDEKVLWEIKSLEKFGKYTLEHALRQGLRQADNLIIDLRRLSIPLEKKATSKIKEEYLKRKNWKGLIVIVRYDGKCLTFSK